MLQMKHPDMAFDMKTGHLQSWESALWMAFHLLVLSSSISGHCGHSKSMVN